VGQKQLAVVSHRYFMSRLGGDTHAIGRVLQIDGQPYEIVGVMRSGFTLLDPDADIWITMGFTERSREPRGRYLTTIGRLKPGLTVLGARRRKWRHHGRAHAGGSRVRHRLVGARRPDAPAGDGHDSARTAASAQCRRLRAAHRVRERRELHCSRAAARRRELAVRSALGASAAGWFASC
jgi:putative ABC transport system permease protein